MVDIVVIGAGPYGLSIAAHLRQSQLSFRVFGEPMLLWRNRMPKGMLLESAGFATSLAAPGDAFPLERFFRDTGRGGYSPTELRLPVETLVEYGLEFQRRCVGSVDEAKVVRVSKDADGFDILLDTGEQLFARKVVVAVGPLAFKTLPSALSTLSKAAVSHSSDLNDLSGFRGQRVAVIGGGQSALETAALLQEQGADVTILARRTVRWSSPANEAAPQSGQPARRSALRQIRQPNFGLGPGWRNWLWSETPQAFHHLPVQVRAAKAYSTFGPAGSAWLRHRVDGVIPVAYGQVIEASEHGGETVLNLQGPTSHTSFVVDHVVAATGYQADIRRLPFLAGLANEIRTIGGAPALNRHFESSVAGLLFAGFASAASFGPSMRFIYGARFAAAQVARSLSRLVAVRPFTDGFITHETA